MRDGTSRGHVLDWKLLRYFYSSAPRKPRFDDLHAFYKEPENAFGFSSERKCHANFYGIPYLLQRASAIRSARLHFVPKRCAITFI